MPVQYFSFFTFCLAIEASNGNMTLATLQVLLWSLLCSVPYMWPQTLTVSNISRAFYALC